MVKNNAFLLLLSLVMATVFSADAGMEHERPIVVIVPSYNNAAWYKRNLDSLCEQQYSNYQILYCDDASTDGTYELVLRYIHERGYQDRVTVLRNSTRQTALYNHYQLVHRCPDHVIIVNCDGDDWFASDQVLATINRVYADEQVWMTYGQYRHFPSRTVGQCKQLPAGIIRTNVYREYDWVTSHLRTFYAGLFKKIKLQDLLCEGRFLPTAGDMAFMFPLLEMAGQHSRYINEILYVYNQQTVLNDCKVDVISQIHYGYLIRARSKYKPLATLCARQESGISCVDAVVLIEDHKSLSAYQVVASGGVGSVTCVDAYGTHQFMHEFLTALAVGKSDYVLLAPSIEHEDCSLSLTKCAQALENTGAYGFYLDRTAVQAPPSLPTVVLDDIAAWQFGIADQAWRNPHSDCLAVYRKKDLIEHLSTVSCVDWGELHMRWNSVQFDMNSIGLCFVQ